MLLVTIVGEVGGGKEAGEEGGVVRVRKREEGRGYRT